MRPERLRYGTFNLRLDPEGVTHLEGELPEVIALGANAALDFHNGTPPLGGPHAEWRSGSDPVTVTGPSGLPELVGATKYARLHVTTPEAEFTYQAFGAKQDSEGWYFLMRLTFTSKSYHEFLAGH